MPELIKTADEAAWLEARRQGVTASEIAVIMGLSPWDSPYALYHRKLGILPPVEDNAAMERGRVLEPYIAQKFDGMHPNELVALGDGRELYAHAERKWQMATPDRLVFPWTGPFAEPAALLECKSTSSMDDWGEPGTDEIPVHYRCQVLWQMDVMGVSKAYVAVLDISRWRVLEYVIEHEPTYAGSDWGCNGDTCKVCEDQQMMRNAGREFLGRIERQDAPDVDWTAATAYALKQLHPSLEDRDVVIGRQLEISYNAACKAFKAAEQRKDEMTNRLRAAMGSARRAVSRDDLGRVIATRQVYEQRESVRKACTVDKIVPAKPKKES